VACLVIFMEVLDTAADPAADAVAADLRVRWLVHGRREQQLPAGAERP
jgi:hypothetical protein